MYFKQMNNICNEKKKKSIQMDTERIQKMTVEYWSKL